MSDRDKIEPQWAPEESPAPPPPSKRRKGKKSKPAPETASPQEPSFNVTSSERRNVIATLLAGRERPAPARLDATMPDAPPPGLPIGPAARGEGAQAAAAATLSGRWIQLSEAQATRHPLFGLGGGLIVIAFLIVAGIARALIEMFDFWGTTDHGGLAAWIMAVLRSGMALWAALILGMLLGRSRAFPANFAAYSMVNIIYLVLFGLAFAHVTNNQVFIGVAVAAFVTVLALLYVLHSARVNVTFRRRVRAKRVRVGTAAPTAA